MSKKHKGQVFRPAPTGPQVAGGVAAQVTQFRSAPLPDPREFERYEQVLPGSAERIMRQFELQAEHRRGLETEVVRSNLENEQRGMSIGSVLAGLFVVGGFIAVMTDHLTPGYAALGWAAAQISGTYLVAWLGKRRQLRQKAEPTQHP